MKINEIKIAVIGLGYVELPLAAEFAEKYDTFEFDIYTDRIEEISKEFDSNLELSTLELSVVLGKKDPGKGLHVTNFIEEIKPCIYYIVTFPTPLD